MGYKLYREVKVWAPATLSKGEKLAAMVLADDANDDTRVTWSPVTDPEILRQAMVPDDRAMRRIIAKLKAEKVVEHAGGGHNGRSAKYRFLHMAPAESTNEKQGGNHPATGQVAGSKPPAYDASAEPKAGDFRPPFEGVAGWFSASSRVETTPPTPPYPSSTTPSSSAGLAPQAPGGAAPEGGGGDVYDAEHAKRAAAFLGTLNYRGQVPTRGQRKKLTHRVGAALAAGWTEQALAQQLDLGEGHVNSAVAVYLHRLAEDQLEEPPTASPSRPTAARCPDCDEDGWHYSDPALMTGPFRCPNRSEQAA